MRQGSTDAGLCANCNEPIYANPAGWLYHTRSSIAACGAAGLDLLYNPNAKDERTGTNAERKAS